MNLKEQQALVASADELERQVESLEAQFAENVEAARTLREQRNAALRELELSRKRIEQRLQETAQQIAAAKQAKRDLLKLVPRHIRDAEHQSSGAAASLTRRKRDLEQRVRSLHDRVAWLRQRNREKEAAAVEAEAEKVASGIPAVTARLRAAEAAAKQHKQDLEEAEAAVLGHGVPE